MLSTHSLTLTESEVKRLHKTFESNNLIHFDSAHQPIFSGHIMLLSDLLTMEDTNQEPVTLTKVKSILFKPETGLVNSKCLLNPIIVAQTVEDDTYYIVSGRHRAVALDLLAQYMGVDTQEFHIKVTLMVFQNYEQLCMSCVIYNTNRTMNKTERDDLVLSSKTGSLSLFDRVSNVTSLKKSFGIELADTMIQNLPETKILRNSFNVLFTRYLPLLEKEVNQVYRGLLSQEPRFFEAAMTFVRLVLETSMEQGVFDWDGKVNFQRELAPKILAKLVDVTIDLAKENKADEVRPTPPVKEAKETTVKKRTRKVKEVKQNDTPNTNETSTGAYDAVTSEPVSQNFPTVQSKEFDEW
jgi:hypothetical protein